MTYNILHYTAAMPTDAGLSPLFVRCMFHPRWLRTFRTHKHCARYRECTKNTHEFTFLILPAGTHMFFLHVNTVSRNAGLFGKNSSYLCLLAFIVAGNYFYGVALFDVHNRCFFYTTSDASEIIFINPQSRNSRAIGPKIRPPFGSLPSSTTAALSSKRI